MRSLEFPAVHLYIGRSAERPIWTHCGVRHEIQDQLPQAADAAPLAVGLIFDERAPSVVQNDQKYR
jgi:hypothetical protein